MAKAPTKNQPQATPKATKHPDVERYQAKVLYSLASEGYVRRFGRAPTFADLNREYPASRASARSDGAWNRLAKGEGLARREGAPQGELLRRLREFDPTAADSLGWALWPLASLQTLSMPQVHALMLGLPQGLPKLFFRTQSEGAKFLRIPVSHDCEFRALCSFRSFPALMAILAVLREVELKQDPVAYHLGLNCMKASLDVLPEAFKSKPLAAEFSAFLIDRFQSMARVVHGVYAEHPSKECIHRPTLLRCRAELRGSALIEIKVG